MKVNFKFFNKKLISKLTAISLAGSLVVGSIPVKVKASDGELCDEVQTILEYKAIGKEYKVVKYGDNNPNNDYYKAKIFSDNNVYIDLTKAMSIDEAAEVLKNIEITTSNIYTYAPSDASSVIIKAGGVPGLSKKGTKFEGLAECHAFSESYTAFDSINQIFDLSKLKLKDNIKPGIYYWHFHFHGKKLYNDDIFSHVFFGIPVIVTSNDIIKYNNGINRNSLDYLDEYEKLYNNYEKFKTLIKKK